MELQLKLAFCVLLAVTVAQERRTLSDVEYYCGNKPADVVFLLDVSNSIWGPDFEKQLDFVTEVVSMFQIGENTTRVGVATFSSTVYREFYLDTYFDKQDLINAIKRVHHRQGFMTNTGKAIWHMRRRMFSHEHGARDNVAKVGIVLTDGQSQSIGRTIYESFRAKMEDIHIFAIGIGRRTNIRELRGLASDPEGDFMFQVEGYNALDGIKNALAIQTCKVTTPSTTTSTTTTTTTTTTSTTTTTTTPSTTTSLYDVANRLCQGKMADVIFAIDSSDNIPDSEYYKQATFFSRLAENFDLGDNLTRIGSILYSDQIQKMFELGDYSDMDTLRNALGKLGMTAGGARVDLAMRHILTRGFRRTVTRPRTSQVGVIITGSPSKYLELSKEMAKKAGNVGLEYIAIGVGENVDPEELQIVTKSNERHRFQVESFDDLERIIPQVAIEICGVPPPVVEVHDQPCGMKQEADIMFLMDSTNAGRRNTKKSFAFLKSIVDELDVDNDNIHVGLMSAECPPGNAPGFGLSSYESKMEIQMAVDSMEGTDFHSLIQKMRKTAFRNHHGGRKHAKKIAILIIDGSLEEPIKTLTEAQRAKIHGVETFVIQVGDEEPQEELLMMCDSPTNQHFYKVKHYNQLTELKEKLLEAICDEL